MKRFFSALCAAALIVSFQITPAHAECCLAPYWAGYVGYQVGPNPIDQALAYWDWPTDQPGDSSKSFSRVVVIGGSFQAGITIDPNPYPLAVAQPFYEIDGICGSPRVVN